jgi:hypothetical protein
MKSLRCGPINLLVVSLSAIFPWLVSELWAKCPTAYVEIRGKIQCSFKADDKILVTLLFRDRQLEASGEEAAFDIHGDAFSGRIAFNTYSSSSFLSGDECHRRPEKVLVRLIEADGTEKDRTLLIMTRDFNYDKENGDFALKSDAILHGWCQSACDRTSASVPDCWRKLEAGPFSILVPSGWEFQQLPGVDSYVGQFVGDGVSLRFDFGRYSDGYLSQANEREYTVLHKSIGGFPAKVVSPRAAGHGITGVYFAHVAGPNALCLWGRDLTEVQQNLALKIFETVRFGRGQVPGPIPPPAKDAT